MIPPHLTQTSAVCARMSLRRCAIKAYTVIRYPGGNFLSGYNWLDGVGPQAQRPRRRELAWQSIETNQFGTNEFMGFCNAIDAAPMLGVNMGTGDIQAAVRAGRILQRAGGHLLVGSACPPLASVIRTTCKYWCVGNEMDGPWQIGHLDAVDYGNKALEAAKLMRWQDPSIKTDPVRLVQ